jgi:hypothetical protein
VIDDVAFHYERGYRAYQGKTEERDKCGEPPDPVPENLLQQRYEDGGYEG